MTLNVNERIFIEQRITNDGKDLVVAYLLAIFLGAFGGHRFYLNRRGSAALMLMLAVTVVGLAVTLVWTIVDLTRLSSMVRGDNDELRKRLTLEALGEYYGFPAVPSS